MKFRLLSTYRGLRREIYVLFIGRVMTNMGSMIWPMFTLIMNRKLGFDATTIAACLLIYSLVSLPISLAGGKLADAVSKKNIIVICDLVSVAGYVYCACVPVTIPSMIVFAFSSLFQSIEMPAYDALVADLTATKDRDRAYSLSYLGNNLGLVLSPTIGGILLENHLNLAFLISGLSILLSTGLIFALIRDEHREEDHSAQAVYEQSTEQKTSVFLLLRKRPVLSMFIVLDAMYTLVYVMYNYIMPLDLSALYGENGSVLFGTMSSVNCIEVVLCTALITRLLVRLPDTGKMLTAQGLVILGYLIFMLFAGSVPLCYVAIIVFTFGEIIGTLGATPYITKRIPSTHRGRFLAVQTMVCNLFSGVVQLFIGIVYDKCSSGLTWLIVIGIGCAVMAGMLILRKLDQREYPALYEDHFSA